MQVCINPFTTSHSAITNRQTRDQNLTLKLSRLARFYVKLLVFTYFEVMVYNRFFREVLQ